MAGPGQEGHLLFLYLRERIYAPATIKEVPMSLKDKTAVITGSTPDIGLDIAAEHGGWTIL